MAFKEIKERLDLLHSMFDQDTFREVERRRRMFEEATQGLVSIQSQEYLKFQEDMDKLRNQMRDMGREITFAANENIRREIELRSEMFGSLGTAAEFAHKDMVSAIAYVAGDNIRELERFFQGSIFENIKSNFDYFVGQSDIEEAMESLRDFQQTFGYEYAQYAERMAVAEEEEKPHIIQEFLGKIDRLWEGANKTKPMTYFLIGLLIQFMTCSYQGYEDDKQFQEQRVLIEAKIEECTQQAQASDQDSDKEYDEYTVTLQAKVYDEPNEKSDVLVILDKHMSVYLEDIDGDWYYVSYVDQIKAVEGIGWIHKDSVIKNLEE